MPVTEVSLGDYVLFGGEVAVLVILEAVTRLLPGVLGNADSLVEESHARRAAGGAGLHQAGRPGAGSTCRRCCAPATTAGSPAGGGTQALLRTAPRRPDLLAALDPADARQAGRGGAGPGPDFRSPPADVAE